MAFRQASMRMSAQYIDGVENPSVEREFEKNLYMSDPPDAVSLFDITDTTSTTITLRWTRSLDEHFASYKIYRDVKDQVDPTSSVLVGTVSDISTTVYQDTGLPAGTTYYYQVFVINDLDEGAGSEIKSGTTTP